MAKDIISGDDKTRVINAIRTAPSAEAGLPAVSVGWRCNKAGTVWAERVLHALLDEGRVEKRVVEQGGNLSITLWRTV